MLKLFQLKQRPTLGIDITSTAVKILEISSIGGKLRIENYGREPLPENAFVGNTINDVDAVAFCIKKLCDRLQITCKQAVVAVPDAAIISKVVQIQDGLNDKEMEELIVFEADKYIPYPINEINLDFEVLGYSTKHSAMLDVLLVASRAENVKKRIAAVTCAGLHVVVVDVDSYAVERAFQQLAKKTSKNKQDKVVAIIDIADNYMHLYVLEEMCLIFSREEQFGVVQLINAISEHYHITFKQASVAYEQHQLPADYEFQVLDPFKENTLLQIKRTLQFFMRQVNTGLSIIFY